MASKACFAFGVLLCMALLVSAEVADRDLAEENNKDNKEDDNGLQDQNYGGGGNYGRGNGGYNRGGGGNYGRGGGNYGRGGGNYGRGGGNYGRGGGGRYPPRCYYGCCRGGYYGGCVCCASADEMPESAYLPEHN